MPRPSRVVPAILALLEQTHSLSAPEIAEALSQTGDLDVNKTSVYRAIDQLLEQGRICRQTLQDSLPVYELRDDHHDHLVCETCGEVQAVECLTPLPQEVDGFVIGHHHLTVYGLCAACRQGERLLPTKQRSV